MELSTFIHPTNTEFKIHTNFFVIPKLDENSDNVNLDPTYFWNSERCRRLHQISRTSESNKDSIYRQLDLLDQILTLFTHKSSHVESHHVNYLYKHMIVTRLAFENYVTLQSSYASTTIEFYHPITGYYFQFELPTKDLELNFSSDFVKSFDLNKSESLQMLMSKYNLKNVYQFDWTDNTD